MIDKIISFKNAYKIANDSARKDNFAFNLLRDISPPFLSNYYLESKKKNTGCFLEERISYFLKRTL